ncbi:MAG: DUF3048 domain-containing protein, partial [bacterium]|nr:DUF3048 domain-containing protein [bacterium]
MTSKSKRKLFFIGISIIVLAIAGVLFLKATKSVEINNSNQEPENNKEVKTSSITGIECENYNQRPIAVMLAEDPITRPLSGVAAADLVIEMPVITGSITRMMAVFQCDLPDEIGSIRSARHDFIPLALGLNAIYAHWGGSHFALDKLDAGIIDNLDAMKDPYAVYFRKSGIEMPHNGFTSAERILNGAKKFGYSLSDSFSGYLHLKDAKAKIELKGRLIISYGEPYRVYYEFNPQTNSYKRWRDEKREIDKNNGNQVEASVVVVMRADSRMIEPPNYNEVQIEGEGEVVIYQNGEEIKGYWKKTG